MARPSEAASWLRDSTSHDGAAAALAARPCGSVVRWMGIAFGAELLVAASVLGTQGITEAGIVLALRLTARVAFPLFWLAYTGGPLAALFGPPLEPLRRHGRLAGLAFATSMTVHLALVAALCAIGAAPAASVFATFGIAAVCMYALALFSISRLRQALGPRRWKVLSAVAMNYVGLAFLYDFSTDPLAGGMKHALFYWPFLALAIAGPVLRIAASMPARRTKRG